ncbi:MAG TPA: hypothetical protein VK116_20060, partial [Planctomycetota bacterium]|nr:hypothetical protein [Planctomycetota bacterium]
MSASTSSPRGALFLGAWLSAAIGFGLGWLGAGLGEPSPSPLAAKPVERQPVESPSGTEANRIDTAAAISAIDPRSLADAIEREFPRVVRSGTGSIEGVLIDEEDRPVGGAMLILEPVLPPPGRSIRERLLHAREVEARTRRRATDPSGLFEFRDLPADGVWSIRGEEIQLYAGAANRRDLRPGEQLELRTPSTSFRFPRATLPVSVRLHGEEVERAQIVCVPESSVKHGVWLVAPGAGGGAPARDEISLGPGQHRYVVRAFLDAELASAPTVVTAEDEGPVVLELEPCTSVFGRLVLPRANDATLSPSLWIHPLEEGGDPKEIDPLKAGVRIQPQQGGFRVVGAEPGRYVVGLTLGDSAILHRWAIDVRPGPQEITLALDAIPDDSLITVSVIDP